MYLWQSTSPYSGYAHVLHYILNLKKSLIKYSEHRHISNYVTDDREYSASSRKEGRALRVASARPQPLQPRMQRRRVRRAQRGRYIHSIPRVRGHVVRLHERERAGEVEIGTELRVEEVSVHRVIAAAHNPRIGSQPVTTRLQPEKVLPQLYPYQLDIVRLFIEDESTLIIACTDCQYNIHVWKNFE